MRFALSHLLVLLLATLPELEHFFVNGSKVTDQGLAALAAAPKLQHFGMHHGPKELTGKGLLAFKDKPNFTSIEFGGMGGITDETVGYLSELPQLRSINIYHTANTRASLPALARKASALESFSINPHFEPARFSDADLAMLAPLKNLRELALNNMVLPYENGLAHLQALTGLKKLSIEWSYYTDEDLAKLRTALPALEIKTSHRAAAEKLVLWKERVADLTKTSTIKP